MPKEINQIVTTDPEDSDDENSIFKEEIDHYFEFKKNRSLVKSKL